MNSNIAQLNNSQLSLWISQNKPNKIEATGLSQAFIQQSHIEGSNEFVAKMKTIIQKASHLATGSVIIKRVLDLKKPITIIEGETCKCLKDTKQLVFNFLKTRTLHMCLNRENERELFKSPKTASLIHELIHLWHLEQDSQKTEERHKAKGTFEEINNQEDELTITGKLENKEHDFCCENSALIELSHFPRINHLGVYHSKDSDLSLSSIVRGRAIGNLRKMLPMAKIENPITHEMGNESPLDIAMHRNLIEKDPSIQKEWEEIIQLLIRAGFKSEYALKIAILENAKDRVKLLLETNITPTDELLHFAFLKGPSPIEDLLREARYILSEEKSTFYDEDLQNYILRREYEIISLLYDKFPNSRAISREIIELLLSYGVQPSEKTYQYASWNEQYEAIKLFIHRGFLPSEQTIYNLIERDAKEIIELLLEKKALKLDEDIFEVVLDYKPLEVLKLFLLAVDPNDKSLQKVIMENKKTIKKIFKQSKENLSQELTKLIAD